jgi:hypothetical protein
MSNLVLAGKYATIHTKNWVTPPKKPELKHDRVARGPCRIKMKDESGRKSELYRDPDEMLKAMHEQTQRKLAPHKFPDQIAFENADKQIGKGIWSNVLVKQIVKLAPNLFVEDCVAIPECSGFYKMVFGAKKFTGASFKRGLMPEFSIFTPDNAGQMTSTGITYGWRMVLALLLESGDLKLHQIVRAWGDVEYSDTRGKHWSAKVRKFRT